MSFNLNFFHILLFYVSNFSIGEFPFDFDPSVIDNGGDSQLSDDLGECTDPSEESDNAENNQEIISSFTHLLPNFHHQRL